MVRTSQKRLYLVLRPGQAIRYEVGVGRAGRQWSGASMIDGMYLAPNWAPPAEIKRDRPGLPDIIPSGSPNNPLGATAMTLSGGQYAIHWTNAPGINWQFCLLWMYPHVQRRHFRPIPTRWDWLARHR